MNYSSVYNTLSRLLAHCLWLKNNLYFTLSNAKNNTQSFSIVFLWPYDMIITSASLKVRAVWEAHTHTYQMRTEQLISSRLGQWCCLELLEISKCQGQGPQCFLSYLLQQRTHWTNESKGNNDTTTFLAVLIQVQSDPLSASVVFS